MPNTMENFRIRNFPRGFENIVRSWFKVIHDYSDKVDGDAIYWYNERVNVGALAAAMARNDLTVVEEFVCYRGRGKKQYIGRGDISFYYHNQWYLAEAKMYWPNLTSRTKLSTAQQYLDKSLDDVKKIWQNDKDSLPFGLTFIVPRIKLADEDHIQELIEAYLDQLDDYQHCDIWAYCAPGKLRRLKSDLTDLFYPLVIMLGKKLA
ncbi:MAG: hypothetical protein LBU23_04975 [Planctomycetota bacterium]|jgi:hypothetical protein|nr:hypothetical protein [Planctomycetota bacterium]